MSSLIFGYSCLCVVVMAPSSLGLLNLTWVWAIGFLPMFSGLLVAAAVRCPVGCLFLPLWPLSTSPCDILTGCFWVQPLWFWFGRIGLCDGAAGLASMGEACSCLLPLFAPMWKVSGFLLCLPLFVSLLWGRVCGDAFYLTLWGFSLWHCFLPSAVPGVLGFWPRLSRGCLGFWD